MIPPPRWWARERSRRRSLCRRRRCLSFLLFFSSVVWSSKRLPFSCARSSSREIAVLYLCLKMMCRRRCAQKGKRRSRPLFFFFFFFLEKVAFRSRGRLAWSWCRLKKVALLFETLADGFFLHRFCREVCTLYVVLFLTTIL